MGFFDSGHQSPISYICFTFLIVSAMLSITASNIFDAPSDTTMEVCKDSCGELGMANCTWQGCVCNDSEEDEEGVSDGR